MVRSPAVSPPLLEGSRFAGHKVFRPAAGGSREWSKCYPQVQRLGVRKFPGSLTYALTPAVDAAGKDPGDLLTNAIKENVLLTVQRLQAAQPILSDAVSNQKLKIVGGVYDLRTGKVELVSS